MVPPDDVKTGIRGNRHRLRGETNVRPRAAAPAQPEISRRPAAEPGKKRVLFVCLGNSCRSQMAEAFARAYGSDVMIPQSAGLTPAIMISPGTKQVLAERNLSVEGHFPKGLELATRDHFDLVVNMSGHPVNLPKSRVITWPVRDPIGHPESVYRGVMQEIEGLVMNLILALRNGRMP